MKVQDHHDHEGRTLECGKFPPAILTIRTVLLADDRQSVDDLCSSTHLWVPFVAGSLRLVIPPSSEDGPIDILCLDVDLVHVHLSQLEGPTQFIVDSMPIRIRLQNPASPIHGSRS